MAWGFEEICLVDSTMLDGYITAWLRGPDCYIGASRGDGNPWAVVTDFRVALRVPDSSRTITLLHHDVGNYLLAGIAQITDDCGRYDGIVCARCI